jgi:hypothetical protein
MRRLLPIVVVVAGCSLQSEGTGVNEGVDAEAIDSSIGTDSFIDNDTGSIPEDSSIAETTTIDSGIDSAKADTSKPDTLVVDTSVVDTSMPDTKPVDTGPTDTGPPDMGPETPGPTLTIVTTSLSTFNVDLSAGSPRDWAHWAQPATDSFNRKLGGSMIAKGTRMGASTFESLVFHFAWTGGDPTATMMDTKRGLQLDTVGNAVAFDVAGDPTTELTLDTWASSTGGSTLVTASLSDAPATSATTTLTAGVYMVTFKYRTASAAGKIKVEFKRTEAGDVGTYSSFFAAVVR